MIGGGQELKIFLNKLEQKDQLRWILKDYDQQKE